MPPLAPDQITPAAGLDRYQAYWFSAVARAVYERDTSAGLPLHELIGAPSGVRFNVPGLFVPVAECWEYGGDFGVIVIEGTTVWQQYVLQAQGSLLISRPEWDGRVSAYWATLALSLIEEIQPWLADRGIARVTVCGHSMGGALAQLVAGGLDELPGVEVLGVVTLASPRVGDGTYAAGQVLPQVRLTNRGDPVPLLPPSLNQPMDLTLLDLWPMAPTSYRHWGTRFHLDVDGAAYMPDEQSTWTDAGIALQIVVSGDTTWYDGHNTEQYARRLRIGIPHALGAPSADFPGIDQVDTWWAELLEVPIDQLWPELPACPV